MQINIQDIIPFMKKGWVAMDSDGYWYWYDRKPKKDSFARMGWRENEKSDWHGFSDLEAFDIAPADDWTKSLIKIDNTAREKFKEEYQNNIQKAIQELRQND